MVTWNGHSSPGASDGNSSGARALVRKPPRSSKKNTTAATSLDASPVRRVAHESGNREILPAPRRIQREQLQRRAAAAGAVAAAVSRSWTAPACASSPKESATAPTSNAAAMPIAEQASRRSRARPWHRRTARRVRCRVRRQRRHRCSRDVVIGFAKHVVERRRRGRSASIRRRVRSRLAMSAATRASDRRRSSWTSRQDRAPSAAAPTQHTTIADEEQHSVRNPCSISAA